jgi:hypothetical protein
VVVKIGDLIQSTSAINEIESTGDRASGRPGRHCVGRANRLMKSFWPVDDFSA